jgi:DNA-binding MarR family transcriptional regulator
MGGLMPNRQKVVTPAPEPSVDELVEAILQSSRALVALSARSIATAQGVTLPQFRMLVVLASEPTNLTGLAAALDVAPSTATRMVDRLVDAGLAQRAVSQHSRRETLLTLTTPGRRLVQRVTARRRRDLRAIVAEIAPEKRRAVSDSMSEFARAAAAVIPGPGASSATIGP